MVSRSAKCYHISFPLKFYKLYHIGLSFSKSFLPCEIFIIRENDHFKYSHVKTFQLCLQQRLGADSAALYMEGTEVSE